MKELCVLYKKNNVLSFEELLELDEWFKIHHQALK